MPVAVLVRHGRSDANFAGVLAGHTAGVRLDGAGREQAARVAERLAAVPLVAVVSSPLARTVQTARAIAVAARSGPLPVLRDRGLVECGYGSWTGRPLRELAKEPLWRAVQSHPSGVTFPDGESMADVQHRAVAAVRRRDALAQAAAGADAVWVGVSHGDVIKAIVADALGLHLDQFQRIVVDPGSVSVIRYTPLRPFLLRLNDLGSDLADLRPRRRRRSARASSDAPVGGGGGAR